MRIKVYHLFVDKKKNECLFKVIGTVTHKGMITDVDDVWEMTNWSCWAETSRTAIKNGCKYYPTKYDRGYTNDDVCFRVNGKWYAADYCGFSEFKTLSAAMQHLCEQAYWVRDWLQEHSISEIKK